MNIFDASVYTGYPGGWPMPRVKPVAHVSPLSPVYMVGQAVDIKTQETIIRTMVINGFIIFPFYPAFNGAANPTLICRVLSPGAGQDILFSWPGAAHSSIV